MLDFEQRHTPTLNAHVVRHDSQALGLDLTEPMIITANL